MRNLIAAFVALTLSACATAATEAPRRPQLFVAAANPLAAEAGMQVLREGGSAADAAVAVQAVLGLVEPQSSGLGGGAFMLYRDGETGQITAYDGRERAPEGANPVMFLDKEGEPLPFMAAVTSGRSTGVPGAVAMLGLAQAEHGKLEWSALFDEAERLGDEGFVVSPRMAGFLNGPIPMAKTPDATAYFTKPDGVRYQAGDLLQNPLYAQSVRTIAAEGPRALLTGSLAEEIVAKTHEAPIPGTLTATDMASYQPQKGAPICRTYRIYVVCVPPPPSSGVAVLQALMLLEHTDIGARGPNDPDAWLTIAQVQRLMYADRGRYVADPEFVGVPVDALLDPAYVASRAEMLGGDEVGPMPQPGAMPVPPAGDDHTLEPGGTSHFVIVDGEGDVASMTTTVESPYGSGRMVGGFFLNNQLTDFSFAPNDDGGMPAANAVASGKRPRSSMTPIIILDRQGEFVGALGSPGGSSILAYNLKALIGVLDWGLSMDEAIELPNLVARGDAFMGETDRFGPEMVAALKARGLDVKPPKFEGSGLHGVIVRSGELEGGADGRREGVVLVATP